MLNRSGIEALATQSVATWTVS